MHRSLFGRYRSRLGRRIVIIFFLTLVAAVTAASASAIFFFIFNTKLSVGDRVAAAGDILAAGTLVLTVIAALVAIAAYAVATGMPDLQIQIWFGSSEKNNPVFLATASGGTLMHTTEPVMQTMAALRVRNRSRYVAMSPAVVVSLEGLAFSDSKFEATDGWSICDQVEMMGITAVQWDGGDAFSIHGHSVRRLPDLNSGRLSWTAECVNPRLRIALFAGAGYHREIVIPVHFVTTESHVKRESNAKAVDWV